MIKIENICKAYQTHQVLDHITFTIEQGQVISIIGASGAGKSTLLRTINALEKAEEGKIYLTNFSIDFKTAKKKDIIALRQYTAMVFQQFHLFQRKTALENVMEGLIVVKKIPKQKAEEIALKELDKVGLFDQADYYPKHLSGGQQQRVALARALAMSPELLLLDEPTSALDPELVGEVLTSIKKIAEEGKTMLLVSHEMNFVRQVSDIVLFLDAGKIIEIGTTEELFNHPKQKRTRQFLSNYQQKC